MWGCVKILYWMMMFWLRSILFYSAMTLFLTWRKERDYRVSFKLLYTFAPRPCALFVKGTRHSRDYRKRALAQRVSCWHSVPGEPRRCLIHVHFSRLAYESMVHLKTATCTIIASWSVHTSFVCFPLNLIVLLYPYQLRHQAFWPRNDSVHVRFWLSS